MHIYLCGFMGSGKSALGMRVAAKLDRPFIDLDEVITQVAGMSISSVFETKGEQFFRTLETEQLESVSRDKEPKLISLGGGAVCSESNLEIIQTHGKLVYLRVSEELLVQRLKGSTKRPKLLKADGSLRDEDELRLLIHDMLSRRERWYMRANLVVEIKEEKPLDISTNILYSQIINSYPSLA